MGCNADASGWPTVCVFECTSGRVLMKGRELGGLTIQGFGCSSDEQLVQGRRPCVCADLTAG